MRDLRYQMEVAKSSAVVLQALDENRMYVLVIVASWINLVLLDQN